AILAGRVAKVRGHIPPRTLGVDRTGPRRRVVKRRLFCHRVLVCGTPPPTPPRSGEGRPLGSPFPCREGGWGVRARVSFSPFPLREGGRGVRSLKSPHRSSSTASVLWASGRIRHEALPLTRRCTWSADATGMADSSSTTSSSRPLRSEIRYSSATCAH